MCAVKFKETFLKNFVYVFIQNKRQRYQHKKSKYANKKLLNLNINFSWIY
ncbi:hypothetical protein CHAB381_1149 [Campylobacter hominis ATCC BAA-381]|uniref:Uncharacterized protein n=1 Tax=Campylobacter hominis (strain ATCC BAA-381 / DSM 21671 / CCUG 45161 / LMG 19568 / NCTC 13146 / CH001A) TaxID=360107 RepID=A7I2G4_CAMHC|nr:hypothetical protein CHAB381_1149 [Campylobacter hominis ATCC BAA-381]